MADSEQRTAPAAAPPEALSLGQILKQARIARDLSLEQASTELRIEVQQLDALEQNRFERIGVPVFIKGYLRQYGTLLGLDVGDLLALYYKQVSLQEIQIQPSKTIRLRDERQITVWIIAGLIIAALVAALGVWWWNGGGFTLGPTTPATQTSTEPSAPPGVVPAPIPAPITAAQPELTAATSAADTVTAAGSGVPAALPASALAAPAGSDETVTPSDDADEPAAADGRAPSFTAALEVTFEQESWAEISDVRGERLFYGLGRAGRNAKLSGEPPFAVVLGNSAGVKTAIDGDAFPVPTDGRPGDYSRFSVDVAAD
jgi:cytoskeleton protein RodZ